MTFHPDSITPRIDRLARQVEQHVSRHLERGDTVFYARPLLASLAISLMTNDAYHLARARTTEAALSALEANDAEGEVYAIRTDLGNGLEDGRDRVRVTRRSGVPTDALYGTENNRGQIPVIRAHTS